MTCLTLNASYEPLTLIPVKRALRLVIDRKAEALEVDESRPFRSENLEYAAPVVIRLVRYVHVPRQFRRQVTNTFLFARDDYECQYCGRGKGELGYRGSLTRDHVVPLSRGGDNDWTNVVTACSRCNRTKADRLPSECGMELRSEPQEPNHVRLIWSVRKVTPLQAKYIKRFYGEEVLSALTG
jgi:5-methylcytosine-specific restriction endonuclease McrA